MPDIIGPLLGGGGGGGSTSVESTLKVGGDGTTISADFDLDNIQINKIADININSNLEVKKPIVTESTSKSDSTAKLDLKIEPIDVKIEPIDLKIEPIKAEIDTNSVIDLKPVAVDSCQTIKLAPLPPICIDQPYSQHFGFTIMGMEVFGFNISGKSEMMLHSPGKPKHHSVHMPGHNSPSKESTEQPSAVSPRGGIRVRIGD
jgi:hypothetical protein